MFGYANHPYHPFAMDFALIAHLLCGADSLLNPRLFGILLVTKRDSTRLRSGRKFYQNAVARENAYEMFCIFLIHARGTWCWLSSNSSPKAFGKVSGCASMKLFHAQTLRLKVWRTDKLRRIPRCSLFAKPASTIGYSNSLRGRRARPKAPESGLWPSQ
jgi:hypothetical protein